MKYTNEFKDLLLKSKESLIGWGNPDAKILVEKVTPTIFCCNKLLLNWGLRNERGISL